MAAALGLDATCGGVVWLGTAQNAGPSETVPRLRSTTKPDPASHHFSHPPGDRWEMVVYADSQGATWLWCAEGEAVVVVEDGIPGA